MNFLRRLSFACMLTFAVTAIARPQEKSNPPASAGAPQPAQSSTSDSPPVNEKWMLEGQKRYMTNCGRCHQAPHLFSPREMAMAVRHMRVRAMLTQEDMDYLLYFMTHQ